MDLLFDLFVRLLSIFIFFGTRSEHVRIKMDHNTVRFAVETLINTISHRVEGQKLIAYKSGIIKLLFLFCWALGRNIQIPQN